MSEISRDYTFSDAELMVFANNLVQILNRDATELADFGVDAAAITAFQTQCTAFQNFPQDTFYQADVGVANSTKEATRSELIQATRRISNRALAKWGENSSEYKKFGVKGLSDMTDKTLLATALLAAQTAEIYLSALASEGLTQDMIDDYKDLVQQFQNNISSLSNAIDIRDNKTRDRILLGNQLYSLISKYAIYGKTLWEKTNSAKYNDYIIYQKEAGGLSVPANFRYDFIGKTFWWDVVNHATSYQLEKKEGDEYVQIYAGKDPEFQYTPPDGQGFYRVRARNMNGFGPATEDLEQWYYAVLPPASNLQISDTEIEPGKYNLTWDAVPTATEYSVYRSVVNNGQPAGDYSLQGKTSEPYFIITVESGKRNYFRVNTRNMSQYAQPSSPVWVEI